MARNETLESILSDFRLDAKLSPSVALNAQDEQRQIRIIQSEQKRLWEETDWPHLRVERFLPQQAGQRFYDLSSAVNEEGVAKDDLAIDRIEMVEAKDGGVWYPLREGIGRSEYVAHDSALNERSSPAQAWRIYEGEQLEIWPVPEVDAAAGQEGYIRVTGIRQLRPFSDMSDRADLDSQLISLYAAGRYLASKKAADTEMVLGEAKKLFDRLTANLKKSEGFQMFGVGTTPRRYRGPMVTRYKAPE
jgi:hypothetical protein